MAEKSMEKVSAGRGGKRVKMARRLCACPLIYRKN